MSLIDPSRSLLLVVDFQARLMPVIDQAEAAVRNAARLVEAARTLAVPIVVTEQNARGLGATVAPLAGAGVVVDKMSFGSCGAPGFAAALGDRAEVIVSGCEAHVCVLQTVLGLLDLPRKVFVVRDAVGSRRAESKETAIARMERHGAEIVTTEMVVFEWLRTADHPRFRAVTALVK
jgi:nicotinamidase-related amidase